MDDEQDDPLAVLREDVNRVASPLYRLLHPWARPEPAPEPRAPGQPGPNDPALSAGSHIIHGENLGAVDNLRITVTASIIAVLTITGLSRGVSGRVAQIAQPIGNNGNGYTLQSTNNRVTQTFDLSIGAGQRLESLFVSTSLGKQGQVYVSANRTRITQDGTIRPVELLIAGYVTVLSPLGWPGSFLQSSVEGRGFIRGFLGTTPAVAAEVAETVPFNTRWRFQSVLLSLVTSAVVGTRYPGLQLVQNGMFTYQVVVTVGQQQNLGSRRAYGPGLTHDSFGPAIYEDLLPVPTDTFLVAGDQILTSTFGMLAGDQYSQPQLCMEEWLVA